MKVYKMRRDAWGGKQHESKNGRKESAWDGERREKETEAEKQKQKWKEQESRVICCSERTLGKAIAIVVSPYQNLELYPSI